MPRGPRLDQEGAFHHVIVRGIERRNIFLDEVDRADLLARLSILVPATGTAIFAWSLLPNHFHLLLRSGKAGLSTFMRRLTTGYASGFNRRHRRGGHLFQNRFKSILVEEEPYFLELVRYLHLNPLRAGLVKGIRGLDSFPWSGHAVILGRWDAPWQDVGEVLRRFGRDLRRSRAAYRSFVSEGVQLGRRPELSGGGLIRSIGGWEEVKVFRRGRQRWTSDERVLGSGKFVEEVLAREKQRERRLVRPERQERVLRDLLQAVASKLGVTPHEVLGQGRRRVTAMARAVVVRLAVERLGLAQVAAARFLGLSPAAASLARTRGAPELKEIENRLESLLNKLIK